MSEAWPLAIERMQSSVLKVLADEYADQRPLLGMPRRSTSLAPPAEWDMGEDNSTFRLFSIEIEGEAFLGALWMTQALEQQLITTCGELYAQLVDAVIKSNPAERRHKLQLRPLSMQPDDVSLQVIWIPIEFVSDGRLLLVVARDTEQ